MAFLTLTPVTLREANQFITDTHRHNKKVAGHRFTVGLRGDDGILYGVAVVGRVVGRGLHADTTAEITRLCVRDDAPPNSCSRLYRAAWRAWKEMGGRVIYTYTLQTESGASLRGAGFMRDAELGPRDAAGWQNREGRAAQAVVGEPKIRWKIEASCVS